MISKRELQDWQQLIRFYERDGNIERAEAIKASLRRLGQPIEGATRKGQEFTAVSIEV